MNQASICSVLPVGSRFVRHYKAYYKFVRHHKAYISKVIDKHVVTKREQIFCQKRNDFGRFLNSRVYAMLWVVCWGRFAGGTFGQRVKHYCGSVLGSHVDLELVCKRLRSVRTWGFRQKIEH